MHKRVDIKPRGDDFTFFICVSEITARVRLGFTCAQIRSDVKGVFDATSRETCTLRRPRTNTPLQALITLNDPVFVECAQALARKMALKGGDKLDGQIAFGLREALLREPRAEEIAELAGLYRRRIEEGKADKAAMEKLATDPLGPLPAGMDAAHAVLFVGHPDHGCGTGFVISKEHRLVATNAHVADIYFGARELFAYAHKWPREKQKRIQQAQVLHKP